MKTILALLAFVTLVVANPVARDLVLHEQVQEAPTGFVNVGPAPSDQVLNLKLGLVSNNIDGLEEQLYAVSEPSSALYGQHLTKEQQRMTFDWSSSSSHRPNLQRQFYVSPSLPRK